ncbi:MAG: metallophosphoesterase [Clostridia bacterium]|nr:metallophosphoesterase [Clostridia bacterium]
MLIALFADIHGNLPALEAVLKEARALKPDLLLSLGDQVNLGPASVDVLSLLRAEQAQCLHGNHERYILECMDGKRDYDAVNFASVRFLASRLKRSEITFPMTAEYGGIAFCHALPTDDRFPLHRAEALERLEAVSDTLPARVICGHSHDPRRHVVSGRSVECIGSLGCQDQGIPGMALWATIRIKGKNSTLIPRMVAYDPSPLKAMYLKNGLAGAAPIMSRVCLKQLQKNQTVLIPFLRLCEAIARERNEHAITPAVFSEADERFPWGDGLTTYEFWKQEVSL